ncbi:GNAT family N-acetyltransferase [Clostridium sp. YIM B02505]|uniref:GNAT family N-acetyltransferase n=1 Tax=Clostridium yunnanense TaxID=2800325 RepID=A0ABS1EWL3_9CLOT|nr:GNAT family protein [Clostridium yunnanense]MBK1813769.1 GNAT family N-acetyltransferase [Clostridium yunnanense]
MISNGLNVKELLELNGEKVFLKKLGKEYGDDYWKAISEGDIESTIFTGTQQVFNKENIENYLQNISLDSSRVDFIIFSKITKKVVGEVVLNDIYRNNRSSNIRIVIFNKQDFNKGYGTEALVLALQYGFGMLNLHRIELEALSFNERAIKVYEKVGFDKEGVKREGWYFNHRYHDLVIMSILEDGYRSKYIGNKYDLKAFL